MDQKTSDLTLVTALGDIAQRVEMRDKVCLAQDQGERRMDMIDS